MTTQSVPNHIETIIYAFGSYLSLKEMSKDYIGVSEYMSRAITYWTTDLLRESERDQYTLWFYDKDVQVS